MDKRVVLITGDSSGFGLEMVKHFINNGDIVCGMSRHDFSYPNLYHLNGDITNEEDIKMIIDNIINKYKRIDILINNAGSGIYGAIEETSYIDAKKQIDVTFYGAYLVSKEVIPYMRESGGGKIINISSIASIIPLPFQGFYSAAKSAMDTLFNALRAEVRPFNIQICSVKPGDAQTSFTSKRDKNINASSIYYDALNKSIKGVEKDENGGFMPSKLAKVVLRISKRKRMPYSRKVGFKDSLLTIIYKILPNRIKNYALHKIYASK